MADKSPSDVNSGEERLGGMRMEKLEDRASEFVWF